MNYKLIREILTEKCHDGSRPYSQGRLYLFISVISYFITLGLLEAKTLRPTIAIDIEAVKVIINALQWSIMLFAGYAFGGKGIDAAKAIMNSKYLGGSSDAAATADTTTATATNPPLVP